MSGLRIVSLGTLDPQAHGTGFSGYELSDDGLSIKRIVQASTFTAEPNHWALQDVRVYTPDTFTQEQEPDFVLPLRQDPETFRLVSAGTKPQQLPLWQLGDAISQLKSSGSNVEALRTAWHAKLAYAASILVMAFVATAIVSWKDNIYIAVTVALLCTFLYFAVYTLGTTLGQRGILHLCGQIQQLLDLCAFACIVGINGFRSLGFQLIQHPEPQGTETVKYT